MWCHHVRQRDREITDGLYPRRLSGGGDKHLCLTGYNAGTDCIG
ncbi:protein of unknown function [Xenorhabdus nematophila AN6/1]|nr:hypothetical protein XNA1_1110006 [Xenorhabdus nematophila str. Anatoliense]CEE95204.1 hypothetical protein XNA1_5010006 [Xenorhabdus nematophila str. Anatoliense]CEF30003.1 hypothetical protein XNW1_2150006 [Xenorhabdus nematophila str. Websteri]CEF34223.1 hypothetical protein XNW1_870006 [Xenorhabdus nematophila str. Websteri]CEK23414.1 protein of unknown function [Xenorhabdus nematophila AN6/1]